MAIALAEATTTRRVDEIVWREDLYPRIKPDPALIQRYAESLDLLPPIEINQNDILIDGFHRWTAHRKAERETLPVTITVTASEAEVYALAIQRNAAHGLQMNEDDKRKAAIRLYGAGTGLDKEAIATALSVSLRMINNYLSDVDRRLREERKQRIFEMWLACETNEGIVATVGLKKSQVDALIPILEGLPKSEQVLAAFSDTDFTPPLYNIWSFAKKSNAVGHFGNSEQRILENLLYLYTEPFDIVVDPFAGGGSTIDVCKKRLRRYWISDRKPIVEREREIRLLDVATELPLLHNRWSDVTLTYLDPPYWKQAEGKYSNDADDLANMPLDKFTATLAGIVRRIAAKQSKGAIALLMQPTQWHAPSRNVVDHVIDLVNAVDSKRLRLDYRVSCPYSTEQYTPQMVEWAKENKKMLVLTRELVIWKVINGS